MKLSDIAIQKLIPVIMGGEYSESRPPQYRKLEDLVLLYQRYGGRDTYSFNDGEPKNPRTNQTYSRKDYTKKILRELNGSPKIYELLQEHLNNDLYREALTAILNSEGYDIKLVNEVWTIGNIDIDTTATTAQISFAQNRDKILGILETAKISINIAMAWFTSEAFLPILKEKLLEGVEIKILINRDSVNTLHGCDLSDFSVKYIRGISGGIMHDKLCVIDNQIVISGSYNWSDNAENRNVENVVVIKDNACATETSLEFRRLWSKNESGI